MFNRMWFFVGLLLLLGVAHGRRVWEKQRGVDFTDSSLVKKAFEQWKVDFHKKYTVKEERRKFLVFIDSWKSIVEWNENPQGNWTQKVNQFADMTRKEFTAWVRRGSRGMSRRKTTTANSSHAKAPSSVDWRTKGVVTPVKNQGQCGSCWSFSTTGAISCRCAIKHGQLHSLSEQQLIDCSGAYGNNGCNGGVPVYAMQYVQAAGGLCLESRYSYTAQMGVCRSASCGTKYDPISTEYMVQRYSTAALEAATAQGCVSVAVDAPPWQFYSSGVFNSQCGTSLDHAVLVVGYGGYSGQEYWIVKNSWGGSWGMNGYIELCKNCYKNNGAGQCGILLDGSFPVCI